MANTKEIQKRMKSVKDTMKITNAMYMISSSKLRGARKMLENTEPYFFTLQSAFSRFLRYVPELDSVYFKKKDIPEEQKKKGYIVISADKGLAGAYNHNVMKAAQELFERGGQNRLFVVGELGRHYFKKAGMEVDTHFRYTVQNPSLHRARVISERVVDLFQQGELDEVYIIYTKMQSAFEVTTDVLQLLPLKRELIVDEAEKIPSGEIEAEPSLESIVKQMVPNYVTGIIYGALVESYASEQNSRMMAMESATKSAKDMLQMLQIEYNRVRQAAITQELTEVISGAKAQKKKKKR